MEATFIERPIPSGEGLTFEKVWAMSQETDRKIWENAQQMKETDRQMKEIALRFKETDRKFKETERLVKETSRQMGLLHNSFSELAEHLVAPGIVDKFNDLGLDFTRWANNVKLKEPGKKNIEAEIDILFENGDIVIAVEVKSKPNTKDIDEFIKKMEKIRFYADRNNDKRKYLGAIAGAVMGENVRRQILGNKIYVIEQSGDTMKINIPEGFVPREW